MMGDKSGPYGCPTQVSQISVMDNIFYVPFQLTAPDGRLHTNDSRVSIFEYSQSMLVLVVNDQTREKTVNCQFDCISD